MSIWSDDNAGPRGEGGAGGAHGDASHALAARRSVPDEPTPCLAQLSPMLTQRMAALDDEAGDRLPAALDGIAVVDSHVHVFPEPLFRAIWAWFDTHGWPIRYRFLAPEVVAFLRARGVAHTVGLHYAHKPGMARDLNAFVAALTRDAEGMTGLATVHPDDEDVAGVLHDAFDAGLAGVKLHCHVQCFAPDEDRLARVFAVCAERGLPVLLHAGREPKSAAYACDPYELCGADRVDAVLKAHPRLSLVVPHLGADEFDAYRRLLDRYESLALDTTMMAADYFPIDSQRDFIDTYASRMLYGTDFPNLPYAWDREAKKLVGYDLGAAKNRAIFSDNARAVFGLAPAEVPGSATGGE